VTRDVSVTDSESDGIRHFFRNPKSIRYKNLIASDSKFLFRSNSTIIGVVIIVCCVFFTSLKTNYSYFNCYLFIASSFATA